MKININNLIYTLAITSVLGLTGCSESTNKTTEKNTKEETKVDKTASVENFTKVLNEYHKRNCIAIELRAELPISANKQSSDYKKYVNLEKLGLLKSSDTKFDRNKGRKSFLGELKVEMVDGKKFELTPKGKNIYTILGKSYAKAGFCVAYAQVESITNYTKMTNPMGLTIVDVKYTAKVVNVVPFIDEIVKIESFKHFKKLTSADISQKAKAELILTEMKGWMHSREFKM